jgi:hypothetical protein
VGDTHYVDLFSRYPYEVSSLVIASWACPLEKEKVLREQLYLTLCARFIRDRIRREPEWAKLPHLLIPNLTCRSEDLLRRDVRTLERRFKDRATAGHMAVAFLLEAETGAQPPKGVDRLSINKLAGQALEARGMADEANLKSRLWRPSRSVIHLCAAWAVLAQEHFREHSTPLDPMEAMLRPGFLALMLLRAERMETLVERSRLNINADNLIRFRLVRKGALKRLRTGRVKKIVTS